MVYVLRMEGGGNGYIKIISGGEFADSLEAKRVQTNFPSEMAFRESLAKTLK